MQHERQGTGLGLSIVRQIVMRMHGQVGFDDAPGGGTIFYIELPTADHLARWEAEFATDAPPVADDNPPTMFLERAAGAS